LHRSNHNHRHLIWGRCAYRLFPPPSNQRIYAIRSIVRHHAQTPRDLPVFIDPDTPSQDRPARYCHPMASCRLATLLAMEEQKPGHGRPEISPEIQSLIRRISLDNPLWGAPRIHGELLKLGYDICQTSIAKYMVRRSGPPAQSWRTFIENHFADIGMAFMGPGLRARSLPLVLSRSSRPHAPHCAYQVIRPNLI
jgi:hypothetical protein